MKLIFDLEPVEQARPRAVRMRRGIRMYDPPKVAVFKRQIAMMAIAKYDGKPLEGQLSLKVTFYRNIQKSISKKERVKRLSGEHRPTVKPDTSNYLKSFEDALNGILWKDDALIVHEEVDKKYSDHPRIEMEVEKFCSTHKQ